MSHHPPPDSARAMVFDHDHHGSVINPQNIVGDPVLRRIEGIPIAIPGPKPIAPVLVKIAERGQTPPVQREGSLPPLWVRACHRRSPPVGHPEHCNPRAHHMQQSPKATDHTRGTFPDWLCSRLFAPEPPDASFRSNPDADRASNHPRHHGKRIAQPNRATRIQAGRFTRQTCRGHQLRIETKKSRPFRSGSVKWMDSGLSRRGSTLPRRPGRGAGLRSRSP